MISKEFRNRRIVELRGKGLSWQEIADTIAMEFGGAKQKVLSRARVRAIYLRDAEGVRLAEGNTFYKQTREKREQAE